VRARACLQVPAWPGCEVISRAPRGAQTEPTLQGAREAEA
jgi:hypothetical protein